MIISIRLWSMQDSKYLAKTLNNKKVHDSLRDRFPLPYTGSDAESFISTMLSADQNTTYARANTVDGVISLAPRP